MILSLVFVVVGIAVLVYSANVLVESCSSLALHFGVSLAVVGAVVVGFGTSLPELAVSLAAAIEDDIDLATGNVVGSMVANLSLVLGGAVLISQASVSTDGKRLYLPLSLLSVLGFVFFSRGGISRWEGIVMLVLLILSLSLMFRFGTSSDDQELLPTPKRTSLTAGKYNIGKELPILVISLLGIVAASYCVTHGGMDLADRWGVRSGFIGLSLIAVGTSLPELVASTVAIKKGKHDLTVGTVLGSNIFNGFGIGGFMGIFAPGGSKSGTILDVLGVSLTLATVALGAIFIFSGRRIVRTEAAILLGAYIAWMIFVGS